MSIVSIIVAIDQNNAIGKDKNLLCYLPNDLKEFKRITSGHAIIMGRKTFESLPNGALPNRNNIVLSSNTNLECKGCALVHDLQTAIAMCKAEKEIFIIGGATLYNEAIAFADRMYVTHIEHAFDGADTFFPSIDLNLWKEVSRKENMADDKNSYVHSFVVYERR